MIFTIELLKDKYKNYNNVYEKLMVEEKNNRLIKIKRGLYTDNINENQFLIGNILYSPSYISFETALSFHNMIPERVVAIRSATFKKNKSKTYRTKVGLFCYQDINQNAYPYGIDIIKLDGEDILIASKEKALTDMLSIIPKRKDLNEMHELLFDDLRINEYVFDELDFKLLSDLCDLYQSYNLKLLKSYIRRFL